MRFLMLWVLVGCRLDFDSLSSSTSAALVTGVTSADVTICAEVESTATWVLLRSQRQPDADDVRALAAGGASDVVIAAGTALAVPGGGCATVTARVLDPVLDPTDDAQERREVFLHAVVDANQIDARGTASATARMQPTFELASFTNARGHREQYWIHYPEPYYRDPTVALPTLVFLHGWGDAVGGANGAVSIDHMRTSSGFLELYEERADVVVDQPFVVVAPQCDQAHDTCFGWITATPLVEYALDHAAERVRIDPARIYVTGVSTGGEGVWRVVMELATLPGHVGHHAVAAAVPVASTLSPNQPSQGYVYQRACGVVDTAIWAFHSEDDELQKLDNDASLVAAYNACAPAKPAVLTTGQWRTGGSNHAGWVEAYRNLHGGSNGGQSTIYAWMLGVHR